jgi:facilitated trehalose transporter
LISIVIETVPVHLKGAFGTFPQLQVTFALAVVFALGLPLPTSAEPEKARETNLWRFIFAFPMIISIIHVIALTFFFKDETPKYLL